MRVLAPAKSADGGGAPFDGGAHCRGAVVGAACASDGACAAGIGADFIGTAATGGTRAAGAGDGAHAAGAGGAHIADAPASCLVCEG